MSRLRLFCALAASVALFAACGGGSGSTDEAKLNRRERALDQREKQMDDRERALNTTAAAPLTAATTTTAAPSPYPREIPIDGIQDQRIRDSLQRSGATTAVELAPGVYAEKGQA